MRNRDPGGDDYYQSSRSQRREARRPHRRRVWKPSRRSMIPACIIAGMIAIPVASEYLYSEVPFALLMPLNTASADELTPVERRRHKLDEESYQLATESEITAARSLMDGRSPGELRREIRRYAPMIAQGDYRDIPKSLKDEIRAKVPDQTIRKIRNWVETRKPSHSQLEVYARRELEQAGVVFDRGLEPARN